MKLSSKNKNQKKFKGMKQKWENLRDYYTEFGYHYFFNLDSCLCVQGGYETEPKKKKRMAKWKKEMEKEKEKEKGKRRSSPTTPSVNLCLGLAIYSHELVRQMVRTTIALEGGQNRTRI